LVEARPESPIIDGVALPAERRIAENASRVPRLSTLFAAVQAAGLVETLSSPGPITVFAPSNDAFGRLPTGALDLLLKSASKPTLGRVLRYHIVSGTLTLDDLRARAAAGGGKARLPTLAGDPLLVEIARDAITLTDSNGNKSYIETPDIGQANGVMHIVNGVLLPRLD
jgi:uncharacterized surface protein with fasciclin (FAS1) repeats